MLTLAKNVPSLNVVVVKSSKGRKYKYIHFGINLQYASIFIEYGLRAQPSAQGFRNKEKYESRWDFPGNPVVMTLYFQYRGHRFKLWSVN